jgi:heme oxygenase (mycobilin-producing)
MTVIKINAITVPADSGDELARRFAGRAGAVDDQDGFEGFELLKPTDERNVWLVVTRWRDEDAFQAWLGSSAFRRGHAGGPGQASSGEEADHGAGHGHVAADADAGEQRPVGVASELWSYETAGGSPGSG